MRIQIVELHAATRSSHLNDEWFVVENQGDKPFSTAGCTLAVGRGPQTTQSSKAIKLRQIGQIDPGFTLAPNERIRVITGNPAKKAHGTPPDPGGVTNYHLFLAAPLLSGPGSVLALSLRQLEIARVTFDPKIETGVASHTNGQSESPRAP